eukprot:3146789-Pleurochrysis_carterae.AAC.3
MTNKLSQIAYASRLEQAGPGDEPQELALALGQTPGIDKSTGACSVLPKALLRICRNIRNRFKRRTF